MKPQYFNKLDVSLNDVQPEVAHLIEQLVDKVTPQRQSAREELVKKGEEVLPVVNRLFDSDNFLLRWEAAKVLEGIASPKSINKLITLLEDDEQEIQWIAGTGLINIGRESIKPLLQELSKGNKDTYFLARGAHRVLKEMFTGKEKQQYSDFLDSLQGEKNLIETVPVKAYNVLNGIDA